MPSCVVIGLGRFGASVAKTLAAEKCQVLGLDVDMFRVQDLSHDVPRVARCDGTDIDSLRAVGAHQYEAAIVAIRSLEASVLTVLNLKQLGLKTVVAKAVSHNHGQALARCGTDRVVYPHRDMGARIAHNLVSASVVDYIELSPGLSMVEVTAPLSLLDKSLQELALPQRFHVQVSAIQRGKRVLVGPKAAEVVRSGDVLILIGSQESIRTMEEAL